MNSILKSSLLLFTLLISSMLCAQGSKPPPPPQDLDQEQIELMLNQLSTELELSSDQEEHISAIYYSHFEEFNNMINSDRGNDPIMREEMDKKRALLEKEVKSYLNSKQKKQYNAFLEENRPQQNRSQRPPQKGM